MTSSSIAKKILEQHLVEGKLEANEEIALKIDQTLTQDATGTMAYLAFEAMKIPKVKTRLSVSYIDHNTLQTGFENADDHLYLQSVAAKYGILLSKAGNGICHQIHLERFAKPGETLLGSDSHTPTAGGMGMIAIGAGGLDVAVAMAGGPFYLKMPRVLGVKLTGKLKPWVSSKDVILEVLRRVGVKGGVGKMLEYFGDGVKSLSVPERATITNMGTETGATTSILPSDFLTKKYLRSQQRANDWREVEADRDAEYDETIEVEMNHLDPLIAKPHSPGNVCPVKDLEGKEINQVAIGSCTNSSYKDLMTVARILKKRKVHPNVSLVISPGSRQVLEAVTKNGALADIISSGARILEATCGPCIGMGQAPPTGGISLRTFNRNFEGRSGTKSGQVYLCSVEVAAASAVKGKITDPRNLGACPKIRLPEEFEIDDSMILRPSENPEHVTIIRGPNIKPITAGKPIPESISGEVLIKVGDDISTDDIMPAGAKILPLRSNLPAISEYIFERIDRDFAKRAKEKGGGIIVGGENYGQGSSREHAAMAPMYLGVKAVIVKSFARIHQANLVNFGIVPLEFELPNDYTTIEQGDIVEIADVREKLIEGDNAFILNNQKKGLALELNCSLTKRDREILLAGGLLNFYRKHE